MVSLTIRFLFVVELVRCSLEDSLVSLPVRFLFDFVFDSLVSLGIRLLVVIVRVCCQLVIYVYRFLSLSLFIYMISVPIGIRQ